MKDLPGVLQYTFTISKISTEAPKPKQAQQVQQAQQAKQAQRAPQVPRVQQAPQPVQAPRRPLTSENLQKLREDLLRNRPPNPPTDTPRGRPGARSVSSTPLNACQPRTSPHDPHRRHRSLSRSHRLPDEHRLPRRSHRDLSSQSAARSRSLQGTQNRGPYSVPRYASSMPVLPSPGHASQQLTSTALSQLHAQNRGRSSSVGPRLPSYAEHWVGVPPPINTAANVRPASRGSSSRSASNKAKSVGAASSRSSSAAGSHSTPATSVSSASRSQSINGGSRTPLELDTAFGKKPLTRRGTNSMSSWATCGLIG